MLVNQHSTHPLLHWFLEHFPHAFPIIRHPSGLLSMYSDERIRVGLCFMIRVCFGIICLFKINSIIVFINV